MNGVGGGEKVAFLAQRSKKATGHDLGILPTEKARTYTFSLTCWMMQGLKALKMWLLLKSVQEEDY